MADYEFFPRTGLTGGADGDLDDIDGDLLSDGDAAVVTTSSAVYFYHLNATSGAAESSPDIIAPDTNPGNKRWELVSVYGLTGIFPQVNWSKGADVASAGALTLGTDGNYFDIMGTTNITSIGTLGVGTLVCLHFDGALDLTYHATNLILPGGVTITTEAGDEAILIEYASGDWRCLNYQRASGRSDYSIPVGSHDDITATSEGVAASVTTENTFVTTNGDSDLDNVTLADGLEGQTKHILCVVEGNAADTWKITPANMVGGTQITFAGIGEGCILKMYSAGWGVTGNNGGTIS